MSTPLLIRLAAVAGALFAGTVHADPIHARDDGSYWHHDSGWVFPAMLAGFARVGAPQDIAGSRDAVAYYARTSEGERTLASVDVLPSDSAASDARPEDARRALEGELPADAQLMSEAAFELGAARAPGATRLVYGFAHAGRTGVVALYFVTAGDWRVRIRITAPFERGDTLLQMDEFARAQRWETLPGS